MYLKDKVREIHAANPDASSAWIAQKIGCNPAYVRVALARQGIRSKGYPIKTVRKSHKAEWLLKAAARLRAKADELEAKAKAMADA